ncbi:MAG: capsid protein VP2 [Thermoplasmata archaeon]
MKNNRWIQKSIKRKGRVKNYIMKKIGRSGFTERGTIKVSALNRAKKIAEKNHDKSMTDAIDLALRLKNYHRR